MIPGLRRSPGEGIGYPLEYSWASLVAQLVKNLPATWETWARSLGWEHTLEKGKTTHSSFLVWRRISKSQTPLSLSPITSWQIDREMMESVRDFIFLGSKITVDGEYSHEIRRCLFLGRKAMTNLDSILKSRDITLPTKVCLVKAIFFSSSHIWM